MFHYRGEYPGRSERSHRLNIYMHKLHSLAQTSNVAVLITNHIPNLSLSTALIITSVIAIVILLKNKRR